MAIRSETPRQTQALEPILCRVQRAVAVEEPPFSLPIPDRSLTSIQSLSAFHLPNLYY